MSSIVPSEGDSSMSSQEELMIHYPESGDSLLIRYGPSTEELNSTIPDNVGPNPPPSMTDPLEDESETQLPAHFYHSTGVAIGTTTRAVW